MTTQEERKLKLEYDRSKAIEAMNDLIKMAKKGMTVVEESEKLFNAVSVVQTYILKRYASELAQEKRNDD